jgi:hypothetical protein
MAAATQEYATALTQEEIDMVLQQRRHVAVSKAPPKKAPPPPSQAQASQAQAQQASFTPPWAPANSASAARTSPATSSFSETVNDQAMSNMLQTPPEFAPLNIYEFLMGTSINSLLLVSSSDRISARQRQELRDMISILRSFTFE